LQQISCLIVKKCGGPNVNGRVAQQNNLSQFVCQLTTFLARIYEAPTSTKDELGYSQNYFN
jgi:hypothetical protein